MSDTRRTFLLNAWCVLAWLVEQIPRPRRPRLNTEGKIILLGMMLAVLLGLLLSRVGR